MKQGSSWPLVLGLALVGAGGCDCYGSHTRANGEDDAGPGVPDASTDAGVGPLDAGRDAGDETDAGGEDAAGPRPWPPMLLSNEDGHSPRVAMDGHGNATVVWDTRVHVAARRYEPREGWLETEELGASGGMTWPHHHVDFNLHGDGVAIWNESHFVARGRIWAPGSGWLREEEIGPSGYSDVAIDGAGNAVALFASGLPGRIDTVRFEPARGWSDLWDVELDANWCGWTAIAANERGDFVGLWADAPVDTCLLRAIRWVDDRWEDPARIGDGPGTSMPNVALTGTGDAFAVWLDLDGESYSVLAARQPAGAAFGEPEILGTTDMTWSLAATGASDGSAFAAWRLADEVIATRAEPGGGFGDVTSLGSAVAHGTSAPLAVAADGIGGAVVVWSHEIDGLMGLWSCRYVVDHGWGEPVRVDPGEEGDARWPDVDCAPDGTAAIVWMLTGESPTEVWGAIVSP